MKGFVCTYDVLAHSGLIIREFGAYCFFYSLWRAMTADRPVTFLECMAATCPRVRGDEGRTQ